MRKLLFVLCVLVTPLWAVEPDEMLADPMLEARAREISQGLRCPVCQNETIDESHASLARELRIVLRERITAGDSDAQAIDYMVSRYGEFVLLRPDARGVNLVLWFAAPIMLLLALAVGWRTIRRRGVPTALLTAQEEADLEKILKQ